MKLRELTRGARSDKLWRECIAHEDPSNKQPGAAARNVSSRKNPFCGPGRSGARRSCAPRAATPKACRRAASTPQPPGSAPGVSTHPPGAGSARPSAASAARKLPGHLPCKETMWAVPVETPQQLQGPSPAAAWGAGQPAVRHAAAEPPQLQDLPAEGCWAPLARPGTTSPPRSASFDRLDTRTPSSASLASSALTCSRPPTGCLPQTLQMVPHQPVAGGGDRHAAAGRSCPKSTSASSTAADVGWPCSAGRSPAAKMRAASADRRSAHKSGHARQKGRAGAAKKVLEANAKLYAFLP
uniref:Uncharacterized protein n=1 Tax=Alexandrium monilatum TaxID=311494 RepID=A0A7S4PWK2_9DINO|mmetsp:Transcript_101257/g.312270  ORF Transcript_101257/g.312270 Transcript_101257/m.312270 type:complete len:298 (+) Transcript_101257:113-1006(+)